LHAAIPANGRGAKTPEEASAKLQLLSLIARNIHLACVTAEDLTGAHSIEFTFHYPENDRWEGKDYSVSLLQSE
jgi:hypothetical protein